MSIENNMFKSILPILNDLKNRKKETTEKLQQLPSESIIIPQNELNTIRTINALLQSYIKKVSEQIPPVPKGGEQEKRVVKNMMSMLDKLDGIWLSKFSTESQGSGENLVETPEDSIYYMSHSGASIRFKMANIKKGLREVIQPFAEFIFFDNPEFGISETPKMGYFTEEYFTKEFSDWVSSNKLPEKDFESSIKKYYQNKKIIAIPKTNKVIFHHNGSPINKIYF